MSNTSSIEARLQDLVQRYNREQSVDAALKVGLGVAFSLVTFGMLFWFGWFAGVLFGRSVGLQAWQCGALLSGLFFIVALWSAWQNVNPLAGLRPLSDGDLLLTLLSQSAAGVVYFSPRHATAGAAVVLLGGPASILHGFGIWTYRIRVDDRLLHAAAELLAACEPKCPTEDIRHPPAALLLRRLALVKVVASVESPVLTLTEKGRNILAGKQPRAGKGAVAEQGTKAKRQRE